MMTPMKCIMLLKAWSKKDYLISNLKMPKIRIFFLPLQQFANSKLFC